MRTLFPILIIAVFLGGCGTALKQNWYNFTAYYNTFYNANQYFDEGLEKNLRQREQINPEEPVRIHLRPTAAGAADFALAIEKGADILRFHGNSKYVPEAIKLIGKSYYYRGEYFSALEKFQELYNISDDLHLRKRAAIWEGRTYLELELYGEGSRLLQAKIDELTDWDLEELAEARAILAQHHVKLRNWETAATELEQSLDNLDDRDQRARGFFLYAQVLEQLNRYDESFMAYQETLNHRPYYDLEYNTKRKAGELLRKMGDYNGAFQRFRSMERDDKHFGHRPELLYEMARTLQMRGDTEEAAELYEQVLRYRVANPGPATVAKTYYGIAEIYRYDYSDYELAAAYYDSAATRRVDRRMLPQGWNARELASAFGEYARTAKEISRQDSLLNLGMMPTEEFDAVIEEIREQRERELQQIERRENQMTTITAPEEPTTATEEIGQHGFLNIQNRTLLDNASVQFRAIWGNRPLADNWRRRDAVTGERDLEEQEVVVEAEEVMPDEEAMTMATVQIELSEIPFTEQAQDSMRNEIYKKYYQLGSVFLLNLDMPDSARVYFHRVAASDYARELTPRSIYALIEISITEGQPGEAEEWGRRLINEYPDSPLAVRAANRLGLDVPEQQFEEVQYPELRYRYSEILNFSSPLERAQSLYATALNYPDSEMTPKMLYEAATEYVRAGRNDPEFTENYNRWSRAQIKRESEIKDLEILQDSARVMLSDTTLLQSQLDHWQMIADSTLADEDLSEYPFRGEAWDSARVVLTKIDSLYSNHPMNQRARYLREVLEIPDTEESSTDELPAASEGAAETTDFPDHLETCEELDVIPVIRGGEEAFLANIVLPEWTESMEIQGEIEYRLVITREGEVVEYEHIDSISRSGIPQAFEKAIEDHLVFEPLDIDEQFNRVSCVVTFPIQGR